MKPIFVNKAESATGGFYPSRNSPRLYLDELLPLKDSVGLYTRKTENEYF